MKKKDEYKGQGQQKHMKKGEKKYVKKHGIRGKSVKLITGLRRETPFLAPGFL